MWNMGSAVDVIERRENGQAEGTESGYLDVARSKLVVAEVLAARRTPRESARPSPLVIAEADPFSVADVFGRGQPRSSSRPRAFAPPVSEIVRRDPIADVRIADKVTLENGVSVAPAVSG